MLLLNSAPSNNMTSHTQPNKIIYITSRRINTQLTTKVIILFISLDKRLWFVCALPNLNFSSYHQYHVHIHKLIQDQIFSGERCDMFLDFPNTFFPTNTQTESLFSSSYFLRISKMKLTFYHENSPYMFFFRGGFQWVNKNNSVNLHVLYTVIWSEFSLKMTSYFPLNHSIKFQVLEHSSKIFCIGLYTVHSSYLTHVTKYKVTLSFTLQCNIWTS